MFDYVVSTREFTAVADTKKAVLDTVNGLLAARPEPVYVYRLVDETFHISILSRDQQEHTQYPVDINKAWNGMQYYCKDENEALADYLQVIS